MQSSRLRRVRQRFAVCLSTPGQVKLVLLQLLSSNGIRPENAVRIAPTDEAVERRAANIGRLFGQPNGERPVQEPRLKRMKRIPRGWVGWGFTSWHNAFRSEHACWMPEAPAPDSPGKVQWQVLGNAEHYNYFRDYDPGIGRYVQSDPIGLRGGTNTYLYALANPIRRFDSNGLTSITVDISHGMMLVDPEMPGRHPYFVPITSGRGQCMNDSKCSSKTNEGPTPPGPYVINVSEMSDPGPLHDLLRQFRGDWGDWRVPLRPEQGNNTRRSGFFIHGGIFPGSAGCIDIGGGIWGNALTNQLRNDLLADPDGNVPVNVH